MQTSFCFCCLLSLVIFFTFFTDLNLTGSGTSCFWFTPMVAEFDFCMSFEKEDPSHLAIIECFVTFNCEKQETI